MPPSRIDELRRRVQNDPASIAFAQLAEEYRRAGQTDEAVRICREGLTRHPGYLSARVTLGRALLDLGELAEARGEFEFVVAEAPENLAAVRGLAEIFHREGQTIEALSYYERALALSRHDPEIEEIVQQLSRQVGAAQAASSAGLSYEEAHQELLSAAERVPLATPAAPVRPAAATDGSTAPFDFDRLVAALGSPTAPPQFEAAVTGQAAVAPIELPDVPDLGPNPFAALEAELRAHEAPAPATPPWAPTTIESAGAEVPAAVDAGDVPALATDAVASHDAFAGVASVEAPEDPFAGLAGVPEPPAPSIDFSHLAESVSAAASAPLTAEDILADTLLADTVDLVDLQAPSADLPSAIDALLAAPEPVLDAPVLAAPEPVLDASVDTPLVAIVDAPVLAPPTAIEPPVASPEPAAAPVPSSADRDENVLGDLENWLTTLHDRASE